MLSYFYRLRVQGQHINTGTTELKGIPYNHYRLKKGVSPHANQSIVAIVDSYTRNNGEDTISASIGRQAI